MYPALDLGVRLVPEAQISVLESWAPGSAVQISGCSGGAELSYSEGPPLLVRVGTENQMTFGDVLNSGAWVLDLHSRINGEGWTWPTFLGIFLVVIVGAFVLADKYGSALTIQVSMPRLYLYIGALIGFSAAALEGLVHLAIASKDLEIDGSFGTAFSLVFLPNLAGIVTLLIIIYAPPRSNLFAFLELPVAFSFLFFFYSGLYVAPALWMLGASVRLMEVIRDVPAVSAGPANAYLGDFAKFVYA